MPITSIHKLLGAYFLSGRWYTWRPSDKTSWHNHCRRLVCLHRLGTARMPACSVNRPRHPRWHRLNRSGTRHALREAGRLGNRYVGSMPAHPTCNSKCPYWTRKTPMTLFWEHKCGRFPCRSWVWWLPRPTCRRLSQGCRNGCVVDGALLGQA